MRSRSTSIRLGRVSRARSALFEWRSNVKHPEIGPWKLFGAGLAAIAAVIVFALFTVTPLRSYASAFLTIFQPKAFAPILLTRADLRTLHLSHAADSLGTQRILLKSHHSEYGSFAEAKTHLRFPARTIASLPADFVGRHRYAVITPGALTFTFSAAKAAASAKHSHRALTPMPSKIDGSVIRVDVGEMLSADFEKKKTKGDAHPPFIELIEAQSPRVSSSGASLQELERYLLSMPGISPKLVAQLQALSDPMQTLPIPIDVNKESAQPVTVDGVQGLAIGDNTGLGAGVIWQKDGIVYAVGGLITMDEALTLANGLE
jgi:hypothetical protein